MNRITEKSTMKIIYILDLAGTFTFAISGSLSAAHKRFDIFGALVIAFVTAVGGGTVRDLLLGNTPVFWLNDLSYISVIVSAAVFSILFVKKDITQKKMFLILDSVGLGVFTVIGIQKAALFHLSPVFCVLMGIITAVVGGMFRDILCNKIPQILKTEIYASACLAGGIFYYILKIIGVHQNIVIVSTVALVIAIRLISIRFDLSLPKTSI